MHCAFIINGQSKGSKTVLSRLHHFLGTQHAYWITKKAGDAIIMGHRAIEERFTHIVAIGGDGTINEVINGMLNHPSYETNRPFFSILPRGTGNDSARTLGISASIEELKNRLLGGSIRSADAVRVDFTKSTNDLKHRYFFNVMDVGLGGHVAHRVANYRRKKWSLYAYQRAIIRVLPFYKKQPLKVFSPDFRYEGVALSVVIANGRWFGGGIGISPDADMSDGKLNVVIFGNVTFLQYLFYFPRLMAGKKINHAEVHYFETERIEVTGTQQRTELDGECCEFTPIHVHIEPGKINLLL